MADEGELEPKYWLAVERKENWIIDKESGFKEFGLTTRFKRSTSAAREGDLIFTYVSSGISCFSDIRKITKDGNRFYRKISDYDSAFDIFLETAPVLVLERANWVPIKGILQDLDLTRGKKEWRHSLRASIRQISKADAKVLMDSMQTAKV